MLIMIFGRTNSIATLAIFMILQISANALASPHKATNACRWTSGSFSYAKFVRDKQDLTYRLSTKNEKWNNTSFGHHSTGILSCEDCVDGSPASGMYNFLSEHSWLGSNQQPPSFPKTAKQRIQLAFETAGYPHVTFSGNSLEPLSHREDIQLDRYSGYSVLFKVIPNDQLHTWLKIQDLYLLILSLTDGCLRFDATLELQQLPKIGIGLIDNLLSDISISYDAQPFDTKKNDKQNFDEWWKLFLEDLPKEH